MTVIYLGIVSTQVSHERVEDKSKLLVYLQAWGHTRDVRQHSDEYGLEEGKKKKGSRRMSGGVADESDGGAVAVQKNKTVKRSHMRKK